ncbi:5-methylcytosine-specific restriction endonuclease McrA [Actinopolymorpha cephalotaxi]|uniref:5-methylcytosine-specific restriction endonuclease McrA n=1 Tax=Actinopolymorpha cephalotaxi TaxID=504797 RepID=A0A1I3ATA7_9ACTN|nr:5-methylcytosine-specific restriction endonuclease McrA [Actinopolymorpha cephalotaxi]
MVVEELRTKEVTVVDWQHASAETGVLLAQFDRAANQISNAFGLTSTQQRVLAYLRSRIGQKVPKEELRGVAGIYEWARRIRELRVEHGWAIVTNVQRPDLKPGEYVLEHDQPDRLLADDWALAKRLRNSKESGKDRGLKYLQALSPRSADKDQLAYVMQIQSRARRIRELDEEGWEIQSNVDDPSLAPGSYRLASLERRPPRTRKAIKLRHTILERDGKQCQDCGRSPDKNHVTLQIHHRVFVSQGGTNDPENLITLCSDCHAGRHALVRGQVVDELLVTDWEEDLLDA